MPKTVNPDPEWTDTLEMPLPHETMDSADVAVPDTRLLANDKWLKKEFGARLDALERALWPTTIRAELTASETDSSAHIWRFEYSLSTNRGTITSATLDFGDGSPVVTLNNPGMPGFVTHDYPDVNASYTAVLNVQTSDGASQRVEHAVNIGAAAPGTNDPATITSVALYTLKGQTARSQPDNSDLYTPDPGYRLRELHTGYAGPNYYSYAPHDWSVAAAQSLPQAIHCYASVYRDPDGAADTQYDWDTVAASATIQPSSAGPVRVTISLMSFPDPSTLWLEYGGNGPGFAGTEMLWTDSQVLSAQPQGPTVQFELDRDLLLRGEGMIFLSSSRGNAGITISEIRVGE